MKKVLLIVFQLLITVAVFSQSNNDFDLPDYSKSRAYNSIDYLNRLLKPNGKIDQILADNPDERAKARALDMAEQATTHIETVKKDDPSYPVDIFERRQAELIAKAKGAYESSQNDRVTKETTQQTLSSKQGYLMHILIDDQYSPYFPESESNDLNFLQALAELDWKNTKPMLEKYLKEYPNEAYTFERLSNFEENFKKQQDEFLASAIKETIDWAYMRESFSKPEARKYAKMALTLAEASLVILPNHNRTLQLKAEAEKAVAQFAPNYSSDFHKNNAGKIVFSKQLIVHDKEGAISSSFVAGNSIYAMAYLDGGWADYSYASKEVSINVYVDGVYNSSHSFGIQHLDGNQMYLDIELLPETGNIRHEGPAKYANGLKSISASKHQITIELIANYGFAIAKGSFELDATGGTDKINEQYLAYKAANAAKVILGRSKRNDPKLEAGMVQAIKSSNWTMEPVKATIFDSDWRVVRNTYTGEILYRAIRGEVSAKGSNGECQLYFVDFKQDYLGNGNYSSTTTVRQSLGSKTMDCANLTVVQ